MGISVGERVGVGECIFMFITKITKEIQPKRALNDVQDLF